MTAAAPIPEPPPREVTEASAAEEVHGPGCDCNHNLECLRARVKARMTTNLSQTRARFKKSIGESKAFKIEEFVKEG